MIKTLQKKFIFTAMTAISLLLLVMLGAINGLNFLQLERQTGMLLDVLSREEAELPDARPEKGNAGEPPIVQGEKPSYQEPPEIEKRDFWNPPVTEDTAMSARFFVVRFDMSGNVVKTDVSRISSVTEVQAESYAKEVLARGELSGKYGLFRYKRMPVPDSRGEMLLFLDCSAQRYTILTVLALSVLIGLMGWGAMLLLVILLSKRAILPIAQNLERQKQFVTDAGHEIKTPLAIIMANTEAMELHSGENKWSRNIKEQTMRLTGLMQNLLVLARADEGKVSLSLSEFSLSVLTEEVLSAFCEPAALKGVFIETEIRRDVNICADRENIRRLLSILFDNAVKYVPSGGRILVVLRRGEKKAFLQVRNTCSQKPVKQPEKLFDRFYRGDQARTQKDGGYGIGLSAARAIVETCHGSIEAAYEGESEIVFTIQI